MKGFSRRNLYRIKRWYSFYFNQGEFVPQLVAQIPRGYNALILEKIKEPSKALWYIQKTLANNWSRNVLGLQIENRLYLGLTLQVVCITMKQLEEPAYPEVFPMHVKVADNLVQGRPEGELEQAVREGLLLHDYLNATISLGRFAELMGVSYTEGRDWLHRRGIATLRRFQEATLEAADEVHYRQIAAELGITNVKGP